MRARTRLVASLCLCAVATALAVTLTTGNVTAAGGSANIDQCANGPVSAPVPCTGVNWQNGNANANNAHWAEGESIAYRLKFGSLVPGSTHYVTIQWDTTKGGKHALDYLTSYNRTEKSGNDPCSGIPGCGSPLTFPIPPDVHTGLNLPPQPASPADGRWNELFTMFNGTITNVEIADPFIIPAASVPYNLTGTYAVDSSTSITITFTAASATPVLAWGGHIAERKDWGSNNSASAITGSPFHMRVLGLDGAGGNQDRGLSSSAVIYPALLTITKNVLGSNGAAILGPTAFNFAGTSPAYNTVPEVAPTFTLVNDGGVNQLTGLPNNQQQFKLFSFGTTGQVTITEANAPGFALIGLTCQATLNGVPEPNTNTVNVATRTATIVAAEGEEINCAYVNQQYATLTVIKSVVETNGGTAGPEAFTLRVTGSNGTNLAGPGSSSGTTYSLPPGTYTVSEAVPLLSGYKQTGFSGDCDASGTVVLSLDGSKTCKVTNNDLPGHLIVKKLVVNTNGGTMRATDFSFSVNGGAATPFAQDGIDPLKGLNTVDVPAGSFSVVENATPIAGYTTTYSNCSGTILNDATKTCTITNSAQAAHLIINKVVTNDNGGSLTAASFSGTFSGVTASGGQTWTGASTDKTLTSVGSYSVAENPHPGYDVTFSTDCTGTIALGETKTCTVTNDDQAAHLIVNKLVVNDNGGGLTAAAFSGTIGGVVVATGGNSWSGASTDRTLTAIGSYSVAENAHPGYDATFSAGCTGTIALGETKTCTVTNDDQPAHLIVTKVVVNNNGGGLTAAAFSGTIGGAVVATGGNSWSGASTDRTLTAVGSYSVAENAHPGYDATFSAACTGTIALGETKTCTVTNDDQPAHLIVNKVVVNDNGGALTVADFSGTIGGAVVAAGGNVWAGASTDRTLTSVGSYSVAENAHPGYDATFSAECTGAIALGDTKTCTVTNDDQAPHLIINKVVVNNDGGSLTAATFSGTIGGAVVAAGGNTWAGASTNRTLTAIGGYSVAENAHPGYDATFSADCTGTIALGDTKTCTVTNDDQPAHLIVNKVVVNNNGGALTAAAFSGTIGGTVLAAGGNTWTGASTSLTLTAVGSYSVAENAHPGYVVSFSAECTGTIALGDTKTCTVTNDDQPARLTLIKHVDNSNGGSAAAAAFTLTASGSAIPGGSRSVPGTEASGVTIDVNAGYYIVTETSLSGYRQTGAVGCEGILPNGGSATCTITNSDENAHPTVATTMSWVLHDSLTVTGLRSGGSGGTVTFRLYGPDDTNCAGTVINGVNGSGEVRPVVSGRAATATGYTLGQAQLPNLKGTFRWIAVYSGDTYNNGAATKCGDETHTITVQDPASALFALFITPVNGATDVDASQPIQWTAVTNAQAYYLYIGTSRGATDLVNSGEMQGTSYQAYGLPAGQLLYARLWTKKASVWRYTDITFTAAIGAPVLKATVITPANGATGVNPTGLIQWTAVPNAQKYYVYVGSTLGANDLIDSQEICDGCTNSPTATSWSLANAGKPPALGLGGKAGQKVYLRMWTMVGGIWRYVDSTFTLAP
jgi:hypothetical protein